MTKEELQKLLDEKGIAYDKRWGIPKLEALLEEKTQETTEIVAEVTTDVSETVADEVTNTSEANTLVVSELTEAEKGIVSSLSGANTPPPEVVMKQFNRAMGEAVTNSGIILPPQVIAQYNKSQWVYRMSCTSDKCLIVKEAKNGYKEDVRVYSLSDHGAKFKEKAQEFVNKNSA